MNQPIATVGTLPGTMPVSVKGNYVRKALTRGEGVVCQASVSWARFVPQLIIAVAALLLTKTVGGALVGISLLIMAILTRRSIELAVTNKRVIAKFGVLRQRTIEMNLNRVESVQVHQGLLGRLFNYGSLVVSGAGNPQAPIRGIHNPMEFRRVLLETQEAIA